MKKAIATVALIVVLGSLVSGYLGTGARGNSLSPDLFPGISLQQATANKSETGAENATQSTNGMDPTKLPHDFDDLLANPVQVTVTTTVMTTTPVPEEPTGKTDPITATSTSKTTMTTTKSAETQTTTKATTTTAKVTATTTTAKATAATTAKATATTTVKATATTTAKATATTTAKATTTTTSKALKGNFNYDFEAEVVRLMNIERGKEGIGPVTMNQALRSAAAVRAVEIVDKFSHERPNGERWPTAIKIPYKCAGENIAAGQPTAERVVQAWMNSESHRKNLMNPRYTEVGVACYHDPDQAYRYYWSQLFIGHN